MPHPLFPNIDAEEVLIGQGAFVHPTAVIRGLTGTARRVVIGDHTYIGEQVQIIVDEFSVGDYTKIHHHTNIHGYKPCHIGHNNWIGQYNIIDSIGGTRLGNNVCVSAQCQLWAHMKFGDLLEGCRFYNENPLSIGDDVYFGGNCIVSPITAADRSMALGGSVVTKDMAYNTIYAGCPAKEMTEKLGYQFAEVPLAAKMEALCQHLAESGIAAATLRLVEGPDDVKDDGLSYFIVSQRQYTKRGTEAEIAFMKYLLPEKAKFVPTLGTNILTPIK
jgi:acetyltransferase-like isoleucine patch superfamily enzyme